MTNHSDKIPNFITALDPRGLRLAMLQNNNKHGCQFQYFDIGQFTEKGKTKFIAWFYSDIKAGDIDSI